MAALNSDHSADDHKNLVNNKNKGSPQDGNVSKKSKKVSTADYLHCMRVGEWRRRDSVGASWHAWTLRDIRGDGCNGDAMIFFPLYNI